jgi:hypothetical protein
VGKGKWIGRAPVPKRVEQALDAALDRALAIERPVVAAYVARIRRRRPDATPEDVVTFLERRYLAAVVGTGAVSGGAAALPGVGTAASIATTGAEIAAFISTTAMFVLAIAEVHGIPAHDPHVRRAMVLTVLLGELGEAAMAGSEIEGKHWARALGRSSSPDLTSLSANATNLFLARFGAKQGAMVMGRALPFGIGAGFGAAGNAAIGSSVVRSARRAFGPAPAWFAHPVVDVEIGPDPGDDDSGPRPPARRLVPFPRR